MNEDKIKKLKELLALLNDSISKEEFIKAFEQLTKVVSTRIDTRLSDVKGIDGKDGAPGPQGPRGPVGRSLFGGKGDKGDPGIQGPKGDKGDAGLDAVLDTEVIKKIEERVHQIELRPTRIGGAKGIGLYVGGSKKLLTAQTLNLVAGNGVSLSYAFANGRNDITISATGTVALTPIAMTGTINDSNKSFTAASTPTLVIVNGASYRNGAGVTIAGTTITLDNPVGTGGDIYGL